MTRSRVFRLVGTVWLLVNVALLGLTLYGQINGDLSYKYEVEEPRMMGLGTPEELQIRAEWIRSDQALLKFASGFLLANILWTCWALGAGRTRGRRRHEA